MECPKCNNIYVIKWGLRKTDRRGKVQRWECKKCGYRFSTDNMKRMRNPAKYLQYALRLHNKGLSTREIENEILKEFNIHISWMTISRWINEFIMEVNKMGKYKITIEGNDLKTEFGIESDRDYILKLFNRIIRRPFVKRKKK